MLTFSSTAIAEGIKRGTVTGETTAKGYDHPNQYIHLNAVQVADNMEPVMPHPEQEKAARAKLAELEKRFGKKPNAGTARNDNVVRISSKRKGERKWPFPFVGAGLVPALIRANTRFAPTMV